MKFLTLHITAVWVAIFFIGFPPVRLEAQTCCSGGVPLSNNIGGMPLADAGSFQLALNFDGNFLRTLKDRAETLEDESRARTTYSTLLKANYSLSEKIAVEALFSAVRQERSIHQGIFNDFTRTTGIGDAVVMGYFTYFSNNTLNLTFGAGPKIPLGPSDLRDDRGVTLNADLQPGSGAWDVILHHRLSKVISFRPSASMVHLVTYRMTGENPDYLGSQQYEFGNELQMILGISEQNTIGKQLVGYGLNLRYRHAGEDLNNNEQIPNTGGQWIFIMPAMSWYINPQHAFNLFGEVPLYSQVTGTQLTPSYRFNAGLLWTIKSKNKAINTLSNIPLEQ